MNTIASVVVGGLGISILIHTVGSLVAIAVVLICVSSMLWMGERP